MKKIIKVGNLEIGNGHIVIQSMTNSKTSDTESTIKQILELEQNGCELIRVAVKDENDALAIKTIKENINIPLVADIHFDYKLALLAIESGIDKIRINPGNMPKENVKMITDACNKKNIPIRIGVNSGSLSQDIIDQYGVTAEGLVQEMIREIHLLEDLNFNNIILSLKATDINTFIEANRKISGLYDYPLHIGLTEAGTVTSGSIRSSYAIGTLIKEGIGDTIRVSLTGNPLNEIIAAKEILKIFNKFSGATLISCPTCGRTEYNMEEIIKKLEPIILNYPKPVKIAVMGCIVNGIGEGKEADLGIAGGKNKAVIFKKGQIIKTVDENYLVEEFIKELNNL